MVDCDTIDAALAEAEADLQHWRDLLDSANAPIHDAQVAIASILAEGKEVPVTILNALATLYAIRDSYVAEIEQAESRVIQLEKDKKDCKEQQAQE